MTDSDTLIIRKDGSGNNLFPDDFSGSSTGFIIHFDNETNIRKLFDSLEKVLTNFDIQAAKKI